MDQVGERSGPVWGIQWALTQTKRVSFPNVDQPCLVLSLLHRAAHVPSGDTRL